MTLDEYMEWRGITDATAAAALGCARPHLTNIRNGVRSPSIDLAARIRDWSGGCVTLDSFAPPPRVPSVAEPPFHLPAEDPE